MSERKKILIVDDEPEIGRLLQLFLEDEFDVVAFSDPRQACEKLAQTHIDLVISDVKMPFLSGLDVLAFTKKISPDTIVILMTGHAQTLAETDLAKKQGAEAVLFKPFGDPAIILQKINGFFEAKARSKIKASQIQVPGANEDTSSKQVTSSVGDKNRPLVLALDDEPDLIEVLGLLLEDYFEVKLCSDPAEAIEQHKIQKFRLILTDLNMPQMSGLDFISHIRNFDQSTPIVIMSGHGPAETEVQHALAAGANEVLPKPFPKPERVVQIIRKLL